MKSIGFSSTQLPLFAAKPLKRDRDSIGIVLILLAASRFPSASFYCVASHFIGHTTLATFSDRLVWWKFFYSIGKTCIWEEAARISGGFKYVINPSKHRGTAGIHIGLSYTTELCTLPLYTYTMLHCTTVINTVQKHKVLKPLYTVCIKPGRRIQLLPLTEWDRKLAQVSNIRTTTFLWTVGFGVSYDNLHGTNQFFMHPIQMTLSCRMLRLLASALAASASYS